MTRGACIAEGLVVSAIMLGLCAIATDGGLAGNLALAASGGHLALCALGARRWRESPTVVEAALLRFGAVPLQLLAGPFAMIWADLAWRQRWVWLINLDVGF